MTCKGILVEYEYTGDENQWKDVIDSFIHSVNADNVLRGKFDYTVTKAVEGNGRIHIGRWDSEDTLNHLHEQDYFKIFSAKIREFAGETLSPKRFESITSTN